ncbi:hypothetical protein GYM70_03295 [Lactobacillus panisapium]|uniref:hypothetical protein n=1 Tax=Lactobacillus panisapium TaxID=2012495 RepID=UPI001C69926C|nr:hypothetical protein [Lactobacillus panisapium]QYN54436.1 hypothetical protein GYM70_03295 [Lactobacillus panisapium]
MSFWGIVGIVLAAVIILCVIFAFFHLLFILLPAIIVIAGILWLINHFTKKDDDQPHGPDFDNWNDWSGNSQQPNGRPKRKKVRNAHTKDVDK